MHYFKAEDYHCGTAHYPSGVSSIQLNPIIEGKKSPIPIKFSYHEDGQVHFKPIDPKQIQVENFHKFAEVKCTPFSEIQAQHIFTIELERLDRYEELKFKDKREFYGGFKAPDDAKRFKFLGYLGKSEEDILRLVKDAKIFTIPRNVPPLNLYLGLTFTPFKESLDVNSTNKSLFYFFRRLPSRTLKSRKRRDISLPLCQISMVPANQSLKLTEPAVSFSPRAKKFLREKRCRPRVYSTIDLAARRRSLAPVR